MLSHMRNQITSNDLREMYQRFFESKGHARIPSAPLVPEHDPSVLFTTAGMHPLVPYLKGQPHPQGKRLTNVQKCLRTTDIDDVGDATHATVFEMLGNWSLGDYFKKEAIEWSWEFLTSKEWLGLDPTFLAVSVFEGDDDAPRDEESANLWRGVGVVKERIAFLNKMENWWPAGGKQPGPQGPDTEMFFWTGSNEPPTHFNPDDEAWVEIWNDVFMQYNLTAGGTYEQLPQQNVDTGMGLERTIMVLARKHSIYEIDSYEKLVFEIEKRAKKRNLRQVRILGDHIKALTFLLGDEHPVAPSNTDQGYVVRRLIRRAVRSAQELNSDALSLMVDGARIMIDEYGTIYPSLRQNTRTIDEELTKEIEKFNRALERGLKEFNRVTKGKHAGDVITGKDAFMLYESYGFPLEMTVELAAEHNLAVDIEGFKQALLEHQSTSRSATQGKFVGGLSDHSQEVIRYHTATHLLHQALRDVLGDHVFQKGSNITKERLRFDYSHPEKVRDEDLKRVEDIVNQKIKEGLPVVHEEMTLSEAQHKGALGLFQQKYGNKVRVYNIGTYSREICGGPHVSNTSELGSFKIVREEPVSAGVRRIKAVLE